MKTEGTEKAQPTSGGHAKSTDVLAGEKQKGKEAKGVRGRRFVNEFPEQEGIFEFLEATEGTAQKRGKREKVKKSITLEPEHWNYIQGLMEIYGKNASNTIGDIIERDINAQRRKAKRGTAGAKKKNG